MTGALLSIFVTSSIDSTVMSLETTLGPVKHRKAFLKSTREPNSPLNENTTHLSTAPQYQEAAFHLLCAGKAIVTHLGNKMFHNTLRTRKREIIMRWYK